MSIADLGQAIKDKADEIDKYLKLNNIPDPAFSLGSALRLDLPPALEETRQVLFDNIEHLTALLRGPVEHVFTGSSPMTFNYTIVLSAISRFGIAEKVPLDGSAISIDALATACGMQQSDLEPLLRAAIANRTFESVGASKIKHNATSVAMVSTPDLRIWLESARQDITPAAFALPDAIAKWPGADDPTHTAFALANADHLPLFKASKTDPALAERIAGVMRFLGQQGGLTDNLPLLADALDLDSMPAGAVIVDIGGSMGAVLIPILRRYDQLVGIVQDQPLVIERATVPDDLNERLTFRVHDFFQEQPVEGANIYFLRKVLHDWSDEYAGRILRQLIPALKNGARVILHEYCLPIHGTVPYRREQQLRGWDLTLKWLANGKERDEREWKALFASVDDRFEFDGVRSVSASGPSIIEFTWKGKTQSK